MKRTLLIFIGILYVSYIGAQSVSKEIATQVALQYMRNDVDNAAPTDFSLFIKNNLIDTTHTIMISITRRAPLYLVQLQDGWVLVASEYVTTPVLASSPIGQFPDTADMPDGLKWLLSYYEDAMQYTRDSILDVDNNIRDIWVKAASENISVETRDVLDIPSSHEISFIRSCKWNQCANNSGGVSNGKIYNKYCPTWYQSCAGHTYVGCTGIAMGIFMRYYQWSYSAYIPNTIDSLGNTSQTTHLVTYNWSNMPKAIYDTTNIVKVNEIAGFLRDCGYSSKMKYGVDGSAASLEDAKYALEHNFHYTNMTLKYRSNYSNSNWINLLKTEIASNRPIIYAGNNTRGETAHSFVIYGYTSQNKFIINWGWGDAANYYLYTLDDLTPHGHGYSFNYQQIAIIGTTPNYPDCSTTYNLLSEITDTHFEIYRAGTIVVPWFPIHSYQSGVIIADEKVRIAPGFKVERGAHVIFDIKDMYCDNRGEEYPSEENVPEYHCAPQQLISMPRATTSVKKILRNCQILILRGDKTYTITGQEVR